MRYQFTPAVERALQFAAIWTLREDGEAELDAPQLLWGLTQETECRAATILNHLRIDAAAVQQHWSMRRAVNNFPEHPPQALFAPTLQSCLHELTVRLADHPRPLQFATEHILLGLALVPSDVSAWLLAHGLNVAELEVDIHRRAGQALVNEPLDMPDDGSQAAARLSPEARQPSASHHTELAVWRVLDAAENRAREGLRVVEDYVRFVLDDALLTREWKQIRHALTSLAAGWSTAARLAARDTQGDVGTAISTSQERARADIAAVVAANISRLQEALRSLAEFAKTLDPAAAAELEQLRYRTYTLQRATCVVQRQSVDLAHARLYVLLDGRESLATFEQLARAVIAAGVDIVQLRDKQLDDRRLLERARRLRELTLGTTTRFIMNDRPDLARLASADGVHVGQEELSVREARSMLGSNSLVGVSTHSLEQARQAVLDGADYIGVGPTFPSQTKQFAHFTGLELLKVVAAETRLPAFAIGGITLDRLDDVLATGMARVAVAGAIASAADPGAAARAFRQRLDSR